MTSIWLGTAGWSYLPDWSGSFYPVGTSSSDTLRRYFEAFRFVEVDSTFYAAPAPTTVERWAAIVPATAKMSFKCPRELVQDTGLCPPEVPFGNFCDRMVQLLGPRVGAFVVQMQPSFTRNRANESALRVFLETWSKEFPMTIEFRSMSWRTPEIFDLLAAHNVPIVGNDLHDVPDLEPAMFNTSTAFAYLRLIGRHDGMSKDRIQRPQDEARKFWVEQVGDLVAAQVRHVFITVNNHYEGHAPATLRTLAAELRAANIDHVVESSGWPDGQVSLFG